MQIKLTPVMAGVLQTCPFSFREKYVAKTVRRPASRSNPDARLGRNVRAALELFYQRGGHSRLDVFDMLDLLNQKWDGQGFVSIEEELTYKQAAAAMLRDYYAASIHEAPCRLRLTKTFHAAGGLVSVGRHLVSLSGRFDRLDLREDGTLEVISYKTASPAAGIPDPQEFAGRLSNLVYYRLAKDLFDEVAEIKVSHYYLRSQREVAVRYTPAIIEAARAELEILLDELENGFAPTMVNQGCPRCLVRRAGKCEQFKSSKALSMAGEIPF